MNVTTYNPESTTININETQIIGFANEFLSDVNNNRFTLRLHGASSSVEYLKNLITENSSPVVKADVWVDFSDKDGHIDVFDIKGDYILIDHCYNLSTAFPVIEFKFVRDFY